MTCFIYKDNINFAILGYTGMEMALKANYYPHKHTVIPVSKWIRLGLNLTPINHCNT